MSVLFSVLLSCFSLNASTQDHAHHVNHNMVLFGQGENFYASHIVYKVPHNYQVILKVNLPANIKVLVNKEMAAHPSDQFIYLLDHMNISQITQQPTISGQFFRRAADGSKQILFSSVILQPSEYSVVYFDELPLSLEN